METRSKYYSEVIGKLEKFCRRNYLINILFGVAVFLLITLLTLTLFSIIELVSNSGSAARTAFFIVGCLFILFVLIKSLAIPIFNYLGLFRRETYYDVAGKVGNKFPEIKDELLNSMQLVISGKSESYYSGSLINAAFKNVYNKIRYLEFESILNFNRLKKVYSYLLPISVVIVIMFLFIPGLKAASIRLLNFNQNYSKPPLFKFIVIPGNSEITKGEDVDIRITTEGKSPGEIFLAKKDEGEVDFKLEKLIADSTEKYNIKINSVRQSFNYFVTAENIMSDEFKILVIDRPIVKTLDLEISPPAYALIGKTIQKDNGNVTSLEGTVVNLKVSSTKELSEAFLKFSDSSEVKLDVNNERAEGKFTLKKDIQYTIELFDSNGIENSSPIIYQLEVIRDEFPQIKLIAPNKDVSLDVDNRLNLITDISDDFGFSKLVLNYRLSESRYEEIQPGFNQKEIDIETGMKELSVNYIWNLSLLSLGVDDVVSYYLEVFDNDIINGPKSSRTSTFIVKVPSLDEILADADETHEFVNSELEQTLQEAEELQKSLEEIDQELKKDDKDLSWEEKEKIKDALNTFEDLQDKVENLSEKLQEMQNKLQQNDLLSEETLEKYMELQELMDELTSEEMKKALEELQDRLEKMNRNTAQDQLENFKMDEERFKKSIERTLNLLKRIQVEQKVDEIIKRTEDLIKEQNELKEETEQSDQTNQKEKNELANKQKDISDKIDKLEEGMNKLNEKMSELSDMPKNEMEKMLNEMSEENNKQKSDQASQDIQQNKMQNATMQQQQISENMSMLNQQMQQMQNSMMMQGQLQTFTDMMKTLDNLIELSKTQENLKQDTENSEPNSSSFNQNAEDQEALKRNLTNTMKQMAELSQKTFAITPEMGKALGNALKQMQQSIQALQNRNGSMATLSQEEAMENINEAASMMKNSMEALMQGGGSGGMMSMMQQLRQLSSQQMNLNSLTQMLQQMQQGQLTPQQQGELQRLAQQQEMIRKSLAQLNQEAKNSGESKKIPADLDEVLQQMKEVLTNMNSEKLDDELLQKQEHILSKLLDAQRSINERDFEKERKSNTGENLARNAPDELDLFSEEGKDKLKDEINRMIKEGYVKDYEELILKYFEALQKQKIKN